MIVGDDSACEAWADLHYEADVTVAIKSKRFDELITEAEKQPFSGWDFSYVKDRMVQAPLRLGLSRRSTREIERRLSAA